MSRNPFAIGVGALATVNGLWNVAIGLAAFGMLPLSSSIGGPTADGVVLGGLMVGMGLCMVGGVALTVLDRVWGWRAVTTGFGLALLWSLRQVVLLGQLAAPDVLMLLVNVAAIGGATLAVVEPGADDGGQTATGG